MTIYSLDVLLSLFGISLLFHVQDVSVGERAGGQVGTHMPLVRCEQEPGGPVHPHHYRPSSLCDTYLEVADFKDGLRVGKTIFLQVGIEARVWGPKVRDACGWGRRSNQ